MCTYPLFTSKTMRSLALAIGAALPLAASAQAPAELSISNVGMVEGDSGKSAFDFVITRSHNLDDVRVQATTADGSARADNDYTAQAELVTLPAGGPLTATFSVQVAGDTLFEPVQYFQVNLDKALNASITDGIGVGTIGNDDTASVDIADVAIAEGDNGVRNMQFNVVLSGEVENGFQIAYNTENGTATAGEDYEASMGQLRFSGLDGEVQSLEVPINGDETAEFDESFKVALGFPQVLELQKTEWPSANGTIVNDDLKPELRVTMDNGHEQVMPGQQLSYTIEVANDSPVNVPEAWVETDAVVGLRDAMFTCVAAGGASCAKSGKGGPTDLVALPAGSHVTYRMTGVVEAQVGSQLRSRVSVMPMKPYQDSKSSNNEAVDDDAVVASH